MYVDCKIFELRGVKSENVLEHFYRFGCFSRVMVFDSLRIKIFYGLVDAIQAVTLLILHQKL